MSTNSSGKREGTFVMPETFSFGIEERVEEESTDDEVKDSLAKSPDDRSEASCIHKWEELPKQQQTLESESKTIWMCRNCGEKTNTYSWKKP